MSNSDSQASITLRVPLDVKERVERIARANGISQSAVWKILIMNHVRPALETGRLLSLLETPSESSSRRVPVEGRTRAVASRNPDP